MIATLVGRLAVALTRYAHHRGLHRYLSTGCLHGDVALPDGRTGHEYCRDKTGKAGTKWPSRCKFCGAPCKCACHEFQIPEPPAKEADHA